MATTATTRRTVPERAEAGAAARKTTPPTVHTGWTPAADRPDPVDLLVEQNATRAADLVPVRHGRMMVSPFTFYRGAARIMAEDLAAGPDSGLQVQLCGDAHLSNFGAFASPERRLLFDLNDFDETLPGPFEYDVKRMAASFTIAARNNGFTEAEGRAATLASVRAYREAMIAYAGMRTMDIWYDSISENDLGRVLSRARATGTRTPAIEKAVGILDPAQKSRTADKKSAKKATAPEKKSAKKASGSDKKSDKKVSSGSHRKASGPDKKSAGKASAKSLALTADEAQALKRARKAITKAHTRDSLQALSKLGEWVGDEYRIVHQPPVVVPLRELARGLSPAATHKLLRDQFRQYRESLEPDRRHLLERFDFVDVARKVVGVGSVGTFAFIVLLQGA